MPIHCAVVGCSQPDATFRIPRVVTNQGTAAQELSERRRREWISQIGRKEITFNSATYQRVCHRHFIGGSPAAVWNHAHPDWIPTVNMGQDYEAAKITKSARHDRAAKKKRISTQEATALTLKPSSSTHLHSSTIMEEEEEAELSKVKIEVDIAEEPSEYWMTDQHALDKEATDCVYNSSRKRKTDGVLVKIETDTDIDAHECKSEMPEYNEDSESASCSLSSQNQPRSFQLQQPTFSDSEDDSEDSPLPPKEAEQSSGGTKTYGRNQDDIVQMTLERPISSRQRCLGPSEEEADSPLPSKEAEQSYEGTKTYGRNQDGVVQMKLERPTSSRQRCLGPSEEEADSPLPSKEAKQSSGGTKTYGRNQDDVVQIKLKSPFSSKQRFLGPSEEEAEDSPLPILEGSNTYGRSQDGVVQIKVERPNKRRCLRPRPRTPGQEVLERVMQEGSDSEDVSCEREESSGDEYVPSDDCGCVDDEEESDSDESYFTNEEDDLEEAEGDVDDAQTGTDSSSEDEREGWVRDFKHYPKVPPFTGQPGLHLGGNLSPLELYMLLMTPDVVHRMTSETNNYARSVIAEKLTDPAVQRNARSVYNTWTPVTVEEMWKFLAVLVHMGMVKKPLVTDYWSNDAVIETTFAQKLMKRERFKCILAFFHLNDNAVFVPRGSPGHDPLHKVRLLFDHMKQKFKELYTPNKNVYINEVIHCECPWKGKELLRDFKTGASMLGRPVTSGFKLVALCESKSGYIYNFDVVRQEDVGESLDICLRLVSPLINRGYTLFLDDYFCCPELCRELKAKGTNVVGAVRADRAGLPADLMTQPMEEGAVDYRRNRHMVALRWKDKLDVSLLTTVHTDVMVRVLRSQPGVRTKPRAVLDYTANMGNYDHSDQINSHLLLHAKAMSGMKWWKKLALHLMAVMMIQAHILFNKHRQNNKRKRWKLGKFVKVVCKGMAVYAGTQFGVCTEEMDVNGAGEYRLPTQTAIPAVHPPSELG